MQLRAKYLRALPRVQTLAALLVADHDCLLVRREGKAIVKRRNPVRNRPPGYLSDLGSRPYWMLLRGPSLIPAHWMHGFESHMDSRLPKGVHYRRNANLLLSAKQELLADSISRGVHVHPALEWLGDDCWRAPPLEEAEYIDEPCYFVDLICGHFGHALVDTPARLWPLLDEYGLKARDFRFIGFGTHGLMSRSDGWPGWLGQMLHAYGVPLNRLLVIERPTRCRSLLVPRRISPFMSDGGAEHNRVMWRAGDRILAEQSATGSYGTLLFLSRSRLARTGREVERSVALRLDGVFADLGFTVLHPQDLSLSEQVAALRGASHIAGCIGSQMHLVSFCDQRRFKVLRIAPSYFVTDIDANIISNSGGVLVDYVVERETPVGTARHYAPWSLDEADLRALRQFVRAWRE